MQLEMSLVECNLAHVASHEGIVAVEHIAGKNPDPLIMKIFQLCIFSNPEVASVGLTEKKQKNKDYEVKVGNFL